METLVCDRCGRTWFGLNETENQGKIKRNQFLYKLHRKKCNAKHSLSVEEVDNIAININDKHWATTLSKVASGGSAENDINISIRSYDNEKFEQMVDKHNQKSSYMKVAQHSTTN